MTAKHKLTFKLICLFNSLIILNSCATLLGAHYSIANITGNSTINQSELSSDYGDIKINYYANNNNIRVYNNSDSTVVIDLAKSYFINNGRSIPIYNNSEHTTGSAQSSSVYRNSSSISQTTFESTSTKEQRFISIPPKTYSIIKGYSFPYFQGRPEMQRKEIAEVENFSPNYIYIFSYQCGKTPAKQTQDKFYVSHLFKDFGGSIRLLSQHPDCENNQNIIRPDMQYYVHTEGGLLLARWAIATCTLGLSELIILPIDYMSGKKRSAFFYEIIDKANRNYDNHDDTTRTTGEISTKSAEDTWKDNHDDATRTTGEISTKSAEDTWEGSTPDTIKQKYFDLQDQIKANRKAMRSMTRNSGEQIALKEQNTMLRKEMKKLNIEYLKLVGTDIMEFEQPF